MVLDIGQQDGPKPKCYFTHAPLPSYIDNAHPPTKKEPFRTTLDQQYSHNVRRLAVPTSNIIATRLTRPNSSLCSSPPRQPSKRYRTKSHPPVTAPSAMLESS